MFAGRSTRSVPERYGAKPCWPHVQFPSVITSAPAASIRSASFAVMPRPSAAFSPLTMQKSTRAPRGAPGSFASTARRPGAPNTSAMKRILRDRSAGSVPGEPRSARDCPRRSCIARAPGCSTSRGRARRRASRRRAVDRRADLSDGSAARARRRRRATARARLDVDPAAVDAAVEDDLADADDRPVDRRVDVRARRRADVERRRAGPVCRPAAGTSAASRSRRRRPCARAA